MLRTIAIVLSFVVILLSVNACGDYKWTNILDSNNDLPDVAPPVFNPPGNTYAVAQTVSITCQTEGASVFFTLDGSEPTPSSNPYTTPVFVPSNLTLKAKAFKENCNPSSITNGSYVITTPTCANPLISPAGDTFSTPQNITITCTTPGAEIRYTTDGSDPSPATSLYNNPIALSTSATIKARAYKPDYTASQIVAQVYEFVVAAPVFNPIGGDYTSPQNVTISCPTPGAEIKYTLDGSEPNNASTPYTQPVYVSTNKTLKAKAFKTGCTSSNTSTASYSFNLTVANPTFNPPGGITYTSPQNVSISCATAGATIHYTDNGNTPNENSPVVTGSIDVSANTTLKAIAYKSGWLSSQVVTSVYNFNLTVPTPVIDPPSGGYTTAQKVSITCAKPGSTIRYTLNGSEPNSGSTLYTSPITISTNKTLKAKAFYSGWTPSATASADFIIGLYYDFEGWNGNFFSQSGWQFGSPDQLTPHSGNGVWAMTLSGDYQYDALFELISPSFQLSNNAILSFWHRYSFKNGKSYYGDPLHSDIGYVQISTDNGGTWTDLVSIEGNENYQWNVTTWLYAGYNLNEYSGQSIKLKYKVWSQGQFGYIDNPNIGWFIDDVQITNATEVRGKKNKQ